ncbi:MAG: NAD-dependent epimerase/dehydratase family protein [Spirochaetales bacterium]|nr:MAG: NAD-dependent epimerase/dehydratase family protein [Spirochaetales bacterium]
MARACAEEGVRFVHFSSDAVFSGTGGPYTEEDTPAPVNFYGKSKAEAEQAVLSVYPAAAVIRISLVLGFPVASGNSFLLRFRDALVRGKEQVLPVSEVRTPVDVHTLTEAVLELCENRFSGLLHIGSTDSINRYELAKKAATKLGFDPGLVKALTEESVSKDRAPRHKNGIISVEKARGLLTTPMLSVEETIKRAVLLE